MTTLRSPRYRLIRFSWKKSLIPKVSEKWCAVAREIPYQGDLRHFLLRLSEVKQQYGRATRSWQTIQSSSHGIWDGGWLSALNPVFQ